MTSSCVCFQCAITFLQWYCSYFCFEKTTYISAFHSVALPSIEYTDVAPDHSVFPEVVRTFPCLRSGHSHRKAYLTEDVCRCDLWYSMWSSNKSLVSNCSSEAKGVALTQSSLVCHLHSHCCCYTYRYQTLRDFSNHRTPPDIRSLSYSLDISKFSCCETNNRLSTNRPLLCRLLYSMPEISTHSPTGTSQSMPTNIDRRHPHRRVSFHSSYCHAGGGVKCSECGHGQLSRHTEQGKLPQVVHDGVCLSRLIRTTSESSLNATVCPARRVIVS